MGDAPLRFARNIGQLFRFIGGDIGREVFFRGDYCVLLTHEICRYIWIKQNPGKLTHLPEEIITN